MLQQCCDDTCCYQSDGDEVTFAISLVSWPSRIEGISLLLTSDKSQNTVVTLPRFPSPETMAEAAAIPTSPCLGPNSSADQHIQIGTVGPNPNPAINNPEYLPQVGPANVVTNNPTIIIKQEPEKKRAR